MKLEDYKFIISDHAAMTYDIRLSSLLATLEKHKEDNLDLDPDFQRGRVWTKEQQVSFCEFILKGGTTNPLCFNHPGWFKGWKGTMEIVDGLQRLTALVGMIEDEIYVFGHPLSSYEDSGWWKRIVIQMKIHSLQTRKEVLQWYLQINTTGTPHTASEIERVKGLLAEEKIRKMVELD